MNDEKIKLKLNNNSRAAQFRQINHIEKAKKMTLLNLTDKYNNKNATYKT